MKTNSVTILGALIISAGLTITATSYQEVRLNEDGFRFALKLIEQRHFVPDKNSAWAGDQPSAEQENEFIRAHGWSEYAKWHLAIDDRHGENTKARYKFPFGDFKNGHRSALLAIRSRARQYGYSEIENAAAELQQRLESKIGKLEHR
jgi:hypothetical protein